MVVYASATEAGPPAGGVPYCTRQTLPAAEGELYNTAPAVPQDAPPVGTPYDQGLLASVLFSAGAGVGSNTSYVVLQGDVGDNNWVDLSWCTWTGTTGTALFYLSATGFIAGAVQQSRPVGQAPSPAIGFNALTLPDRIRFVGKASVGAGSSSSPGKAASSSLAAGLAVLVTIRYKLLALR
jgi:hypothetical protein